MFNTSPSLNNMLDFELSMSHPTSFPWLCDMPLTKLEEALPTPEASTQMSYVDSLCRAHYMHSIASDNQRQVQQSECTFRRRKFSASRFVNPCRSGFRLLHRSSACGPSDTLLDDSPYF